MRKNKLFAFLIVLSMFFCFSVTPVFAVDDNVTVFSALKFRLGVLKTHNMSNTDWTLNPASEAKYMYLTASSASSSCNIIAPDVQGTIYIVRNTTYAATITIKKTAGTGIAIAAGKTAAVIHNGSDYVRLWADASQ